MPENQKQNQEGVYSNKFHLSYCRFLEREFGKDVMEEVLKEVGVDHLSFSDMNGFQPADVLVKLRASAKRITGVEDLGYLAGRSMPESLGTLALFLLGVTSPDFVIKNLGKLEGSMALKTVTENKPLGGGRYHVETHFKDGFLEAPDACRNRIGTYEAVPRFFGLPFAKVEHPECAFRGDPRCVYIVTMPEYGFIFFRKIALLSLPLFLVAFTLFIAKGTSLWEFSSLATLSMGLIAYAVFKHLNARKSLEWNEYINEGLIRQKTDLEKTLVQIQSLQRLTLSLSQTIQATKICDRVVETLVEDFKYHSSQIWVLDQTGKWLSCRSAKGYGPDMQTFIMSTRFEMGLGWDNPYGLLIQTLEEKKTLLVNDVEETIVKLSPRTQDFLRALHLSSFIITPLFDHDTPVGILTAENHDGKKLDHKDRLLFQSVSNTVASALVKADLFESMDRKIKERSLELEKANQELFTAKEMAIQSDKLSSLGQMAAGVAHEINNPLNFLINIFPDLKRDIDALDSLRKLYGPQVKDPEVIRQGKELEDKADLESHLEEKDFVFSRIEKALAKSTHIANSLKVFSRSSAKEKTTVEKASEMIADVVDLIPQKTKGDTLIKVDIDDSLKLLVNKTELEQVFVNIIKNALDAMDSKGSLEITGRLLPGEVELAFVDHGPGIPEATLKRIFDPFFTTKPPGKGTGLGLTIVAEIVKKYGGRIAVESVPGQGTTFRLHFPAA